MSVLPLVFQGEWRQSLAALNAAVEVALSHPLVINLVTYADDRRQSLIDDVLAPRIGKGGCSVSWPAGSVRELFGPGNGHGADELTIEFSCEVPAPVQMPVQVPRSRPAAAEPMPPLGDPPRRSVSAYVHYCKENRQRTVQANPDLAPTELMQFLHNQFRALSPSQRARYEQMASEDRERHIREIKEYEEREKAMKQAAREAPPLKMAPMIQPRPAPMYEPIWYLTRNTASFLRFHFESPVRLSLARYGETLQHDVRACIPVVTETKINVGPTWRFESCEPATPETAEHWEMCAGDTPPADAPAKYFFVLCQLPRDRSNYHVIYHPDMGVALRFTFESTKPNGEVQMPRVVAAVLAPFGDSARRRDVREQVKLIFDGEGWVEAMPVHAGTPLLLIIDFEVEPVVTDTSMFGVAASTSAAAVPIARGSDGAPVKGVPPGANCVIVEGLPSDASEEALRILFSCVDRVTGLQLEDVDQDEDGATSTLNTTKRARVQFVDVRKLSEAVARFDGVDFGSCRLRLHVQLSEKFSETAREVALRSDVNASLADVLAEMAQTREWRGSDECLKAARLVRMCKKRITNSDMACLAARAAGGVISDALAKEIDRVIAEGELERRDMQRGVAGAAVKLHPTPVAQPSAAIAAAVNAAPSAPVGGFAFRFGAAAPAAAPASEQMNGRYNGKLPLQRCLHKRHPHGLVITTTRTVVKQAQHTLGCSLCEGIIGSLDYTRYIFTIVCENKDTCGFMCCEKCFRQGPTVNEDGVLVHHGQNGRYYCGRRANYYRDCQVCNGLCGPDKGCNCVACRAMDTAEGRVSDPHDD